MVLGQPDLTSGLPNQGQGTTATGLSMPMGFAVTPTGGMLVADHANNRVVFFDPMPTTPGAAAQAALGQPNLRSSSSALTQTGLSGPSSVAAAVVAGAPRMAVADSAANRVLVYTQLPVAGAPMPDPVLVIGQPDFTSGAPGCDADRLNFPTSVRITPMGKLIVVDGGNHRVLVWNQVPVAGPVPSPDVVLGQPSANSCIRNNNPENGDVPARGTLSFPSDAWSDDTRVVVADQVNNRVLIWRSFPNGFLRDADVVLGHTSFTSAAPNDGRATPTASTLQGPTGVHSDGTALAVADALNNRVLVWRSFPDSDARAAEVVLGHLTFEQSVSNDGNGDGVVDGPTAQVFNLPVHVQLTPGALFVTDLFHHRLLRFAR